MELQNHTPFPAYLFRGEIDENLFYGSLLARVTYDLADGRLVISNDQPWNVSGPPWESPAGPMPSDELFYKGGVDLFVFGHARAPNGVAATHMDVTIEVGGFRRHVLVFGDRVWQRTNGRLSATAPQPFGEMPLTLAHAYGGKDVWDELEIPFQDNPQGRGFYLEESNASGRPLPNLEDPEQLIQHWDDRPDPVGFGPCPLNCGLRIRESIVIDEQQGIITELKPTFFNAAFPKMIVPEVAPGDIVRIKGMTERGPLAFEVPHTNLMIRLRFGEQLVENRLAIDQVGIEVDEGRAFVAYRHPFKYWFHPLEKRSCELLHTD